MTCGEPTCRWCWALLFGKSCLQLAGNMLHPQTKADRPVAPAAVLSTNLGSVQPAAPLHALIAAALDMLYDADSYRPCMRADMAQVHVCKINAFLARANSICSRAMQEENFDEALAHVRKVFSPPTIRARPCPWLHYI